MSMVRCEYCDRLIDTDYNAEHFYADDGKFICESSDDSPDSGPGDFSGASFDEWGGR